MTCGEGPLKRHFSNTSPQRNLGGNALSAYDSLDYRVGEMERVMLPYDTAASTYIPRPSSPSGGSVLTYDPVTGEWTPSPAPSDGDVLVYDEPTGDWVPLPPTGGGGSGGGAAPFDALFLTLAAHADLDSERVFTPGTGLSAVDGGAGGTYTLNAEVQTADLHDPVTIGAGSTTRLSLSGQEITLTEVVLSDVSGAPDNAQYVTLATDATLTSERVLTAGTGINIVDNGAGSTVVISSTVSGGAPTDATYLTLSTHAGLSAERTLNINNGLTTSDAGANGNYTVNLGTPSTITSSSTNSVTASSHTHALSISASDINAAPIDATYVVVSASAALTNESTLSSLTGNGLTYSSGVVLGTPSTLTVSTSNGVTASSHTHAITSSSAVSTATASLLATDSSGRLRIQGLGVGAAAGTSDAITMPDNGWIGLGSGAGRLVFDDAATDNIQIQDAVLFVNDTVTTDLGGAGLCVNIGSFGGAFFIGKSSTVSHGMTSDSSFNLKGTETDTFCFFGKSSDTAGGASIAGFRDADADNCRALDLVGHLGETGKVSKGISGYGVVNVIGTQKSGSSMSAVGTNVNIFTVCDHDEVRFIVDKEGDLHVDGSGSLGTWDDHDDVALLNALRASFVPELRQRYADLLREHRPLLEAAGIVAYNDGPGEGGRPFINLKEGLFFTMDAVRQVYERLDARLAHIEQRLLEA